MLSLLRNRRFAFLWFGGLISLTGDWVLLAGLPLATYQLTESTLATGTLFIAATIPRILLGSVVGVLVDRWDRRRTLVAVNLLLAVALLPLLAVNSRDDVWIVYLVAFVAASLASFVPPAEGALLPRLVGEELLVPANALNALNNQLARLIGPAIGGVVVGVAGLDWVVILDAASFFVAALLIASIAVDAAPIREAAASAGRTFRLWASLWRDWIDGLQLMRRAGWSVGILFLFAGMTGVGEGVITTLFVPFATDVLDGGGPLYGGLLSAQAIGGIAGGLVVASRGARVQPLRLLALSAIVFGLIDLVIFTYPLVLDGFVLALVLMVVVGLPAAALGASFNTLLQSAVEDAYRGRLIGAVGTTFAAAAVIGMVVAGFFGDIVGVVPLLVIQAGAYVCFGMVALAIRARTMAPLAGGLSNE